MKPSLVVRLVLALILLLGWVFECAGEVVCDASKDFSTNGNPGGVWSYGYKTNLTGAFNLFTFSKFSPDNNGLMVFDWAKNTTEPSAVYFNPTMNAATCCGG